MLALAGCGRIGFDALGDDAQDAILPDDAGDPDGDGVFGDDNCPATANADQDNEDGDPFGDACDPCPISPNNADPDSDGVGGECDPKPNQGGDRIVFFSGFQRMPADLELAGTWALSNGQIHTTGALNSLAGATVRNAGTEPEVVSTRATIDALFGTSVARPVGIVHHFDAQAQEGTLCVFGIDPSNNQIYALADNAATAAIRTAPTNANIGDSSTFASRREENTYSCDAERLATPLSDANVVPASFHAGLFARSASASFDYLLIVKSTPTT